jgi:hypothetical protein
MVLSVRHASMETQGFTYLSISIPAMVAPPDKPSTRCAGTSQPCAQELHLSEDNT